MKTNRPVYLNLLQYRFPVTAISSILHRISGVVIFLFIPLLLWMLESSLNSPEGFQTVKEHLLNPWLRFLIWIMVSGIIVHVLAGIRHILMDMGWAEEYKTARVTAYGIMTLSAVLIILAGIWLW